MASVSGVIKYCQHALEKYPNDEQKILKCIDKLFHLDVTVQHLQETGIGRTVNALRKEPGDVGKAARALVYKWKLMVAAEESDQEGDHKNDTSNCNGNVSERDIEDSVPKPKNRNDHYEKSVKSSTTASDHKHKHLNGDSSGSKRKHQYSEKQEPETKRLKHSSSSDDRHKRKQIKKENSESETQDSDISQTDDSESETSQSSVEIKKEKQKVKEEKEDRLKSSYSSKNSSHHSHKNVPTLEKMQQHSEKHSKHKSDSRKSDKSLSEEKSGKSHKLSSTIDKENSSSKKIKSEYKSKENEKRSEESSSKHSSKKEHSTSTHKHKDYSDKHCNLSGKHETINDKTEKVKAKSSSSKDTSSDRHKSRENSSSSKHSSSSKEKSNEKHVSSKELDNSSKTDKKRLLESSSKCLKNDVIVKDKKDGERNSDRKKKHSSSSSKSSKSNSSNKKDDTPKKKIPVSNSEDSEDGIDCGSGASFAEALGMINPAKPKKKSSTTKDHTSPNMFSDFSQLCPASLLAPTVKLGPLPAIEISALPEISPNYKPRPPPKLLPHFTDEDAMNHVISSKNQRTKVYSGNKILGKIPTLYEMCVNILQEHIDALEYTGGVPYEILKPVVDKATPQQLFMLEHYNSYLMEDTDHLWQKFCEKHFRNKQRQEMETWREMYMRCQEEQEHRLKSLTANIRIAQEAKKAPIKQTKMAYVDSIVKPPRNVLRKQALHGTAHASTASPAARVASLAAAPNVLRGGAVRPPPAAPVSTSSFNKPKKAPLMQKALQFFRGRKR